MVAVPVVSVAHTTATDGLLVNAGQVGLMVGVIKRPKKTQKKAQRSMSAPTKNQHAAGDLEHLRGK